MAEGIPRHLECRWEGTASHTKPISNLPAGHNSVVSLEIYLAVRQGRDILGEKPVNAISQPPIQHTSLTIHCAGSTAAIAGKSQIYLGLLQTLVLFGPEFPKNRFS